MRPAVLAGIVLAVLPAAARAQTGPYLAVVSDAEVLLRAGPSDKFPDTGTLPRGTRVVVEAEDAGWLAVTAPPGAVSWVPIAFVDFDTSRPTPQNVMAQAEITLAPGKVGLPQPLQEVRKTKVPEGTILTVIGQKVTFDNKQWYPVAPPPGDVRYLPKTAVRPDKSDKPVKTSFVVRDTAPPGLPVPAGIAPDAGGVPRPAAPTPEPKPTVNHPLWAQAEAAERDARFDDAEKLYFQLARAMNEPGGDHDVANLCYTRIHTLREKKRNAALGTVAPQPPPAATATITPQPREDRPTLLPPVRIDGAGPVRPQVAQPPAAVLPSASDDRPRWVGPATLVRSSLALDGRRTYAVETSPGVVRMYAVGAPGVDLDRYANRKIDLYGSSHTRKDLTKPYVIVTEVDPNPQ